MANLYDLKKFDLNLLVIFECIYQHLSISKAAAMLFITPSAVSQSLQRLRQQLNDPLFVRVGGNDSNLLIVFYVQIMPDDFVMQLHRF